MENDLKFAGVSPVIINYNGDADDIYAPVRGSSCDVAIVSPHILDDLYSAQKDEVCLRIEKDVPVMETVYRAVPGTGNIESLQITSSSPALGNYEIETKNLFYKDISGNFRFNGRVKDSNGELLEVNLLYNYTTNIWELDNYWLLDYNDEYFDDNTYSYRVTYENGTHYVYKWSGSEWIDKVAYQKNDVGSYSDCGYKSNNIVHWGDVLYVEMIWGKYAWAWDIDSKRWGVRRTYTDIDGSDYYAMYGESFHRVKNSQGVIVDTLVVQGYEDSDISKYWVVQINHNNDTFQRLIPLNQEDTDRIFTDAEGNLYKMGYLGEVWFWSWECESWVKWVEFTGNDFSAGSFFLDYVIPGRDNNSPKTVIGYLYNNKKKSLILTDLEVPSAYEVTEQKYIDVYEDIQHKESYTLHNGYTFNLVIGSSTIIQNPDIGKSYTFIDKDGDYCAVFTYNGGNVFYGVYNKNTGNFEENDKWNLSSLNIKVTSAIQEYVYFYMTDGTNSFFVNTEYNSYYENKYRPIVYKWRGSGWGTGVDANQFSVGLGPDHWWCQNGDIYVYNDYNYYIYKLNKSNLVLATYATSLPQMSAYVPMSVLRVDSDGIIFGGLIRGNPNDTPALLKYNNSMSSVSVYSNLPYYLTWGYYATDRSGDIYLYGGNTSGDTLHLKIDKLVNNTWTTVADIPLNQSSEGMSGLGIDVVYPNTDTIDLYFTFRNKFSVNTTEWTEHVLVDRIPVVNHNIIWEGYKMPNTYTQDVTLNLDTIQMTSIDPVSLMKYVKIDRILAEPAILTYRELIGKALSYVMISVNKLFIERSVTYGGPYEGDNGLLDLKCQVSNFWDEMGEPSDCYSMIEELLRPFCLVLAFAGDSYQIYNQNKTQGDRTFDEYQIDEEGVLNYVRTITENKTVFDHYYNDWKSNNVQSASIEIGSTYSKVTGTASTKVPEYSTMAIDKVDYNDRNAYDVFDANIQTNKSKGYEVKPNTIRPVINDKDKWFYIWNGVYVNEDYGLKSQGDYVNGYLNINGAYKYLTGDSGHPADWGAILNFYGGSLNPTGTGKEQSTERSVGVKKRITAYFPDNGTPLEFLEDSDLLWDYNGNVTYEETVNINPEISKPDSSDSKFGNPIVMRESNQITYHQEYDNLRLEATNQQTVDLNLVQSYSRTGIDTKINILNNNTCYDKHFLNYENQNWLDTAKVNYFPVIWESENVVVDKYYFSRYRTQETLLRPSRVRPVWDRRRVDIYIRTSDNKIYQFNGKEWVEDTEVKESNSIYLLKMMNGEHLYHTDFRYDVIETADYDSSNPNAGGHYSLTGERYTYYVDEVGGVTTKAVSGGTTYYCDPYTGEENVYLDRCSEGSISIKLPELDDFSATVVVDIYNSSMLGSTGSDDTSSYNHYENIWFEDPDENVIASSTHILFKPYNTTYVKAEHLDLDISMSVPESNLGQMFNQSDIKYTIDNYRNCLEEFQGPSFLVNTFNDLVLSSFSYLIFDNSIADPGDFIIAGVGSRPECFTVQAYMNWLGVIRKIYNKTLVPVDKGVAFNNIRTYITSPETGEYELMVISDSWDLKTNRHTIKAIEDHNLDVDYVGSFAVIEIPRKARNDLFNLPTAVKK